MSEPVTGVPQGYKSRPARQRLADLQRRLWSWKRRFDAQCLADPKYKVAAEVYDPKADSAPPNFAAPFPAIAPPPDFHVEKSLADQVRRLLQIHVRAPWEPNPVSFGAFNQTDLGDAEMFVAAYGNRFRFDHHRDKWRVWNGRYWQPDGDGQVLRCAQLLMRKRVEWAFEEYKTAAPGDARQAELLLKWAISREGAGAINSMPNMAKVRRPITDSGEHWNRDPMLLAVGNGALDLRTGVLYAAQPQDRIFAYTDVPYDPSAQCPTWEKFVDEIFCGDKDLIKFVQKSLGYSATGSTREQCLFCCTGQGANGKTTLLNIVAHTLGGTVTGYAYVLPFASLLKSNYDNTARFDLAPLSECKRFVIATETKKGKQSLDESVVKRLSGSDPINAQYKYRDPFAFVPECKLWLAFNHPPVLDDVSYAMQRRLKMIPFNATFKGTCDDKQLTEKLKRESGGILAWIVRGCLAWQRERGLGEPKAVTQATAQYLAQNAPAVIVGAFLTDSCQFEASSQATAQQLSDAYDLWADQHPAYTRLDWRQLRSELLTRGLTTMKSSGVMIYRGIKVK